MVLEVLDVVFNEVGEGHSSALVVGASPRERRIREVPENDRGELTVLLKYIGGEEGIELFIEELLRKGGFAVADDGRIFLSDDALHAVGSDQVGIHQVKRDLRDGPGVGNRGGEEIVAGKAGDGFGEQWAPAAYFSTSDLSMGVTPFGGLYSRLAGRPQGWHKAGANGEFIVGYDDHKKAAGVRAVACAVITCSDSRTEATDDSGKMIRQLLERAGHTHPFHAISKDDPATIRALIEELSARNDIQAIILNGGTGVSRRDNTFDAVSGMLTKTLPGFGEIFRMLSYQSIGSGAILSRATAGIVVSGEKHVLVFSIPGSPDAVQLAMDKLIVPELSHLVWETLR